MEAQQQELSQQLRGHKHSVGLRLLQQALMRASKGVVGGCVNVWYSEARVGSLAQRGDVDHEHTRRKHGHKV